MKVSEPRIGTEAPLDLHVRLGRFWMDPHQIIYGTIMLMVAYEPILVLLMIGFYFANLWYFEKLYPVIWTLGALQQAADVLKPPSQESP